jgi:sugar phosphate isomerase/epimerase
MNRREFVATSAFASLATALVSHKAWAAAGKKVGLQLYTLRHEIEAEGAEAVLQKIATIGYTHVESYPVQQLGNFFGLAVPEYQALMQRVGLQSHSMHIPFATEAENTDKPSFYSFSSHQAQLVLQAKEAGIQYIVLPYLDQSFRKSIADYVNLANRMNDFGALCKASGIQFVYHNHAFEFETLEGQQPYATLLKNTDKALVSFELDIYWATKAGVDIAALFKANPSRFPLWHVKDIGKIEGDTVPVGEGTINWKHIFDLKAASGLKHYFIEQDNCKVGSPLGAITSSLKYVNTLSKA